MAAVIIPEGISGMSGMCDVTRYQGDTKGLLFSSIYIDIILLSKQRVFCIKHLCQYCMVLDTQRMSRHKGSFVFN